MVDYKQLIESSPNIICHLITLNKTHDYYINQYIKETEITSSQYYMLMFLYYNKEATQSDIAKAALLDRCGVSRAFKILEEKGILSRKINENNKRAYILTITEKGEKIAEFLKEKEELWDEMISKELKMNSEELNEKLTRLSLKSLEFNRNKF